MNRNSQRDTATAHQKLMTISALFSRFIVGALVLLALVSVSFAEVPPQFDDRAFWQLVNDMSEQGGAFTSENLVSNEPNFQIVLTRLKERVQPGGVYLGVGPEQNFTYIAALQPSIAFIIDIRRENLLLHLMYKAIFELAADRATFLSVLFSRQRPDGLNNNSTLDEILKAYKNVPADARLAASNREQIKDLLVTKHGFSLNTEDVAVLDHVHHIFELYGSQTGYSSNINTIDFTNGGGHNGNFTTILTTIDDQGRNRTFLATEENFQFVKRMQQKNLIIPAVGDFGGDKALRAIAEYLKDHDAIVTTFYVSNVEQYLFRPDPTSRNGGAQRFYENVAGLPLEGSSTFIRVSNNDAIKQTYPGFTTHLGSIAETLQAFKENRLQTIRDVFALSRE